MSPHPQGPQHISITSHEKDGRIQTAQIDITKPVYPVQVEVQARPNGKVLYVHVDGFTALRVCQVEAVDFCPPLKKATRLTQEHADYLKSYLVPGFSPDLVDKGAIRSIITIIEDGLK